MKKSLALSARSLCVSASCGGFSQTSSEIIFTKSLLLPFMCTRIEVGHVILVPNSSMDREFFGWDLAEMDSCWSDAWAMACSSNPGSFRSFDNFRQAQKKVCLVLTVFYLWRLHKFECFGVCFEKLKICFGTLRPPGTLNKLFTFLFLEGIGVVRLRPICWLFKHKITS